MLMDYSIEEEIYSLHKVIVLEHSDTDALFLLLLNFAVDNYWKRIVPVPFLEEILFDMTLISVDFFVFLDSIRIFFSTTDFWGVLY